jgi:Uma2 family endonuclease
MPLLQEEQKYTYADYCEWDDTERWELIEGIPYAMSPAPTLGHQRISGELFGQLYNFLKGKPCKVFHAPVDVRLNAAGEDDTVVQPDILVVCDHSKLDGKSCNGAPDLVIEILSPSTADRDRLEKFNAYLKAGVREYWIVDPFTKTVQICLLHVSFYGVTVHHEDEVVPVSVLSGCTIDLGEIFSL